MAVTGTITRSRENDFVEVAESEDQLRQFVENANDGNHVTIHSGTYNTSTVTGGEIEIPQNVTVTILPNADVKVNPSGGTLDYPIFGGATENIVNLNILASGLYKDSVVGALKEAGGLELEKITVDDSGTAPSLTVNEGGNSEIKFGKFDKNRVLYTSTTDGKVQGSSDLVFDPQNGIFTVKGDQVLTGDLSVDGDLDFGSGDANGPLKVGDLGFNRVVTTNNSKELKTQDSLKFDGTNFILEDDTNLLYNKSSADGDADIHFKPNDGVLIEGTSGTTQDGGRLVINEDSIVSGRALHVNQGGKSVGLFLKASNTNNEILRVRNTDQSSDILTVNADRTVELADVVGDTLSSKSSYIDVDSDKNNVEGGITFRDGARIRYNTSLNPPAWQFTNDQSTPRTFTQFSEIHLSKLDPDRIVLADSNGDFTTSSDLTFDGTTAFISSLEVDDISVSNDLSAGSGDGIIRYNSSQSQWEFTDDGNNYTAFNNISTSSYEEEIITENNVQNDFEITLSDYFSGSPTPNDVSLRTWVKDSTSGNPSSGDWIDAIGITTVVRDFSNSNTPPYDYKVYNEHPDSQDFKFVLRKFK